MIFKLNLIHLVFFTTLAMAQNSTKPITQKNTPVGVVSSSVSTGASSSGPTSGASAADPFKGLEGEGAAKCPIYTGEEAKKIISGCPLITSDDFKRLADDCEKSLVNNSNCGGDAQEINMMVANLQQQASMAHFQQLSGSSTRPIYNELNTILDRVQELDRNKSCLSASTSYKLLPLVSVLNPAAAYEAGAAIGVIKKFFDLLTVKDKTLEEKIKVCRANVLAQRARATSCRQIAASKESGKKNLAAAIANNEARIKAGKETNIYKALGALKHYSEAVKTIAATPDNQAVDEDALSSSVFFASEAKKYLDCASEQLKEFCRQLENADALIRKNASDFSIDPVQRKKALTQASWFASQDFYNKLSMLEISKLNICLAIDIRAVGESYYRWTSPIEEKGLCEKVKPAQEAQLTSIANGLLAFYNDNIHDVNAEFNSIKQNPLSSEDSAKQMSAAIEALPEKIKIADESHLCQATNCFWNSAGDKNRETAIEPNASNDGSRTNEFGWDPLAAQNMTSIGLAGKVFEPAMWQAKLAAKKNILSALFEKCTHKTLPQCELICEAPNSRSAKTYEPATNPNWPLYPSSNAPKTETK